MFFWWDGGVGNWMDTFPVVGSDLFGPFVYMCEPVTLSWNHYISLVFKQWSLSTTSSVHYHETVMVHDHEMVMVRYHAMVMVHYHEMVMVHYHEMVVLHYHETVMVHYMRW